MVLRQVNFTIVMKTMVAVAAVPEDLLCMIMMTLPLMMPFVQGILFGMHLVNSQETQVVCCYGHPCFEGHTVVAIVLETMAASTTMVATGIKELLSIHHHLSCQSRKNLEAIMPLVIPFVWCILFGMGLVNSQVTQVVCC
jgi:hypothetical protein